MTTAQITVATEYCAACGDVLRPGTRVWANTKSAHTFCSCSCQKSYATRLSSGLVRGLVKRVAELRAATYATGTPIEHIVAAGLANELRDAGLTGPEWHQLAEHCVGLARRAGIQIHYPEPYGTTRDGGVA